MKTLVVYFSAQGHTRRIAELAAKKLGADIFEIVPDIPYTEEDLDWQDDDARAAREHLDETLQDIKLKSSEVPNWSEYERVVVMYPVWWGRSAWAVNSFAKAVDWTGKTVFPVAVSHSSPLGDSAVKLAADAGTGDWQNGFRFSQAADESEISAWTSTL